VNKGPVYARFALPASKPLLDGQKIQGESLSIEFSFQLVTRLAGQLPYGYGLRDGEFDKALKKSPPEGCEWIILHHGLFPLETKDQYTSVTVTTPVSQCSL